MVDGGLDYQRYGGMDMLKVDRSPTVYLSTDPQDHNKMRTSFHWGSYGKNGDQPVKWMTPSEMSNDHIKNIIEKLGARLAPWTLKIFERELEYRKENNIIIQD